jgi:hypothetical protein
MCGFRSADDAGDSIGVPTERTAATLVLIVGTAESSPRESHAARRDVVWDTAGAGRRGATTLPTEEEKR